MPRRPIKIRISGSYFTWLLGRRGKVWQADGRSNQPSVGRHSLATEDYEEAKQLLQKLDMAMAVKHGLSDPPALEPDRHDQLLLEVGRRAYMDFVGRPRVAGGIRPSSLKRYRAVFDKFLAFAQRKGLQTWNRVTAEFLISYASHLDGRGYGYRTQYLEITTLKQAVIWFVKRRLLPAGCRIELPLAKADGTDTYCWKVEEVRAMLQHCYGRPDLGWLADIVLALATTGLRISELCSLKWSDLDLVAGMIRLIDESTSARRRGKMTPVRTLKSGRGRSFPIQEELLPVLQRMPRHPDGQVFHGPRGGRLKPDLVRRVLIRDVLKPLAERFPTASSEVGFADGRVHSFRHFFCSLCANRGVSQRAVMRRLGHKESRMVEHYYHLHDEEARRQMGRIKLFDEEAGVLTTGGN